MGHNFQLMLGTVNQAFTCGATTELARILREIANQIEVGIQDGIARDRHGRVVGCFSLELDE